MKIKRIIIQKNNKGDRLNWQRSRGNTNLKTNQNTQSVGMGVEKRAAVERLPYLPPSLSAEGCEVLFRAVWIPQAQRIIGKKRLGKAA